MDGWHRQRETLRGRARLEEKFIIALQTSQRLRQRLVTVRECPGVCVFRGKERKEGEGGNERNGGTKHREQRFTRPALNRPLLGEPPPDTSTRSPGPERDRPRPRNRGLRDGATNDWPSYLWRSLWCPSPFSRPVPVTSRSPGDHPLAPRHRAAGLSPLSWARAAQKPGEPLHQHGDSPK